MSKGFLVGISTVLIVGILATLVLYRVYADIPDPDWARIKKKISEDFPEVPQITTAELSKKLSGASPPLIFDRREADEYAVSHIPGAIHAISVEDIEARAPKDAEIVVYCSVGYRSAKLSADLREAGFTRVRNLEGSIFAWANEDRPLVGGDGKTATTVHPYSRKWGELLRESKRHPID